MDASAATLRSGDHSVVLEGSPLRRLPDRVLQWGLSGLAATVLILIGYFFVRLSGESSTAFSHIGFLDFFVKNNWNVAELQDGAACTTATNAGCNFGALALVLGTLITSGIALVIQVLMEASKSGQTIAICGLTPHFTKVFTMVGITK